MARPIRREPPKPDGIRAALACLFRSKGDDARADAVERGEPCAADSSELFAAGITDGLPPFNYLVILPDGTIVESQWHRDRKARLLAEGRNDG